MRRISIIPAVAVLLALAGVPPAMAAESVPFQAELHHLSPPAGSCQDGVCTYVSYGYAFSDVMGPLVKVTATFVWDFTTEPCSTLDPLEFTLVGATGSITVDGSGSICPGLNPERGIPQYFVASGKVTGGTGEFTGITGSTTSFGTLGPNGPVFHMSGTVSY